MAILEMFPISRQQRMTFESIIRGQLKRILETEFSIVLKRIFIIGLMIIAEDS